MGITKQYLRYKPCGTCNLIGSTWARLTVLNSSSRGGQICAVGACEDVLLWNLKKAEKVCCITTKITYRMRPSQGLARHLELIGLTSKKQTRLVTTIVVVCSWNRLLWQQKLSLSNLFHQLITRSLKKWFLESVLALFFFNFQVCPCVMSDMSYLKKLPTDTDENLWVILKTLIKSAHTRRSSSDQSFSLTNLPRMVMFQMWYHSGKPFLNFLNYCFIFDIVRWPVCITKFQMYFPWDVCQQIWLSYTSVHWATLHCSNDWLFANFELTPSCLEPTAWPATEGKRPKLKLLALPA